MQLKKSTIETVMTLMGERLDDTLAFSYWTTKTKQFNDEEILKMVKQAEKGNVPPALFHFLLKKGTPPINPDSTFGSTKRYREIDKYKYPKPRR